jgi:stress-induced morphogen
MADEEIKRQIHDTLKDVYFSDADDMVDVSDGPDDSIHLVIVSRKFDGCRLKEKNDLVWSVLTQQLPPAVWGRISMTIAASPEEIKTS